MLPIPNGEFSMSYPNCLPMRGVVIWEVPLKFEQLCVLFCFSNLVSTLVYTAQPLKGTILFSLSIMIHCAPVVSAFVGLQREKGLLESLTQSISLSLNPPKTSYSQIQLLRAFNDS